MARPPPLPDVADYLVHLPPGELRRLLDVFAAVGEEFSDWQAAADLGLDLDRLRHPNPALRLRRLHSRRYYAQRWGWSKSRVQEAFAGDDRRGVQPWIVERAAVSIGRPTHAVQGLVTGDGAGSADSGGHSADSGGQKAARTLSDSQIGGQVADSGGQSADKEEHYLQLLHQEEEVVDARGEESPSPDGRRIWSGSLPGPVDVDAGALSLRFGESAARHRLAVEAASALTDAERVGWACRVLRAGQMPDADRLRDLGERAARHGPAALVVALAIADHAELRSPAYGSRLRYLDTTLEALSDHARRQRTAPTAQPRTPASPARRAGGSAESDARNDPAGTFARAHAVALAALGPEP